MRRKLFLSMVVLLLGLSLGFNGGSGYFVQAATSQTAVAIANTVPFPVGVAAGFEHTCTLMNDGSVMCWGSNRYGQLGNSSLTLHPFPTKVANLAGTVVSLVTGAYHTCALVLGETVQCWGLNSSGQLGIGILTNSPTPVTIAGLTGVTQIAAGYTYTCALINGGLAGTVACWGDNSFGQLGDGSSSSIPVTAPETVPGLTGVIQISASLDHTCALMFDQKTINCWGKNSYGQLGNGGFANNPSPTPVISLTSPSTIITSVAAGAQHTCALLSSGIVDCWGDGSLGQMGNNGSSLTQNPTPGAVYQLTQAAAISAGGNADSGHTCALTNAAGVVCWGANAYGQLGDGTDTNRNAPVNALGLSSGVNSIAAGVDDTCALMNDHTVRCWGTDGVGQLGDGVISINTTAINVSPFIGSVTQLGMGDRSTCALVNGQPFCWGNNVNGQLGNGNLVNQPAPALVPGLTGTITAIDGGINQTCAVVNGGVECWGNLNPTTNLINPPTAIDLLTSSVTSISVTNLHGCGVTNGAARCWGDNADGQLGDGTTTPSYTSSVAVVGLTSGVAQVSTGQKFSCALRANGTVWCWGDNSAGQLGNNPLTFPTSNSPLQVSSLSSVGMIAAGQDSVCALILGGSVKCWGNDDQGQLGDGTQTSTFTPVQVTGLTAGVSAITAGGYHVCALVNAGVKCWGFNSFGQLGNGLTTFSRVPFAVTGLTSGVIAVAAGGINYDEEQTCAITTTGQLKCWGGDEYGQLGDNLPIQRSWPVTVLGLTGGPEIGINYANGKPGSYFRLAATGFPAGATLLISVDNRNIGSILASSDGYAIFHIKDISSRLAALPVTVTSTAVTASTTVTLGPSFILHNQEGSGPVFIMNTLLSYLPLMYK